VSECVCVREREAHERQRAVLSQSKSCDNFVTYVGQSVEYFDVVAHT
jgi:hypothetical protein